MVGKPSGRVQGREVRRRKHLSAEDWRKKVRAWLDGNRPPVLPSPLLRRIHHEFGTYAELAQSGSQRHAEALLAYYYNGAKNDPRILEYIDGARERYNEDTDREHRGMERAMLLLAPRAGVRRDQRSVMTEDARIEARELFPRHVAEFTRRYGTARGAEKYAVSKIAEALRVSERSVRAAVRKTPDQPARASRARPK